MLAQAKRSWECSGPKITMERPMAPTGASRGKLESMSTTRSPPRSKGVYADHHSDLKAFRKSAYLWFLNAHLRRLHNISRDYLVHIPVHINQAEIETIIRYTYVCIYSLNKCRDLTFKGSASCV